MPRRRKVRAEDLFQMSLPESPALSPDGNLVVYSVRRMDPKENRYLANLFLLRTRGGRPRQLTRGKQLDATPVWSPDGRQIAFLSTREQKTNVWIIPADGGEARQITQLEGSLSELQFSPDGRELLFLHRPKKQEDPKQRETKASFKHITRLLHKFDGFGYFPAERQQVWTCGVRTGRARQITRGDFDVSCPRWSPDGRQIAFLANPHPEEQHEASKTRIFVVAAGGGRPRAVSTKPGFKSIIAWAPEGRSLLFTGHFGGPGEWIQHPYQIWELSLRNESYTELTPWMDNWPFNFIITDTAMGEAAAIQPYREGDEWRIAFVQNEEGACRVYSLPRHGARRRDDARLEFGGSVNTYGVSVNGNGAAAVAAARMMDVGDIYSLQLDGSGGSRRLTQANRSFFGRLNLSEPEEVWFKNGKVKVHGWILKPPGFRKQRKYPFLLQIHGGPMGQYGYTYFHEMHLLAAQGYVLAFSNPRGSCGYGTNWMKSIHGRWGSIDYDDLMAVTSAMARKPYVDGRRMGVLGGSYGGFMTTWILGHTRRFKAGVTMRQAGNRLIQFGASDYNVGSYHAFKSWPWEKPMAWLKRSPNFFAHKIRAPLLIIHSEQDLRCPIAQADELFTILKSQGRTVEYIRFEGESHGLSRGGKPQNRLERLKRIVDWFERYL